MYLGSKHKLTNCRRIYRDVELNHKFEWVAVIVYHFLCVAGVGILASGSSSLQGGEATPDDLTMVKAGISILTAAWVVLIAWSAITLARPGRHGSAALYGAGTKVSNALQSLKLTTNSIVASLVCRHIAYFRRYPHDLHPGCLCYPRCVSEPYHRVFGGASCSLSDPRARRSRCFHCGRVLDSQLFARLRFSKGTAKVG